MPSSHKGSAFEREVTKLLSQWWSNGILGTERDDIFYRTSGSGARATTRGKKSLTTANSYGDVMAIDPIGRPLTNRCLFEIKRGYTNTGRITEKDISKIVADAQIDEGDSTKNLCDGVRKFFSKIKKTGQIDALDLIDKTKGTPLLLDWWNKMDVDREKFKIQFCALLFQRDGRIPCITITHSFLFWIERRMEATRYPYPKMEAPFKSKGVSSSLIITNLSHFLKFVNPNIF